MSKTKPCTCIEQVNKKLEEYNTKLELPFVFSKASNSVGFSKCMICTEKINKHKKRCVLLEAIYCPFCGKKYESGVKGE